MSEPHGPTAARRSKLRDVGQDPDYRYSLANERTFLAWIRTSLALLAGGIAIIQFASDLGSRPFRLAVGLALIVISALMAGASHHRWVANERSMRTLQALPGNLLSIFLGYGLALVAIAVLIAIVASGR